MSKKYWKENDNGAWYLYFNPYDCGETIVFRMIQDVDDGHCYNYVSDLLSVEQDEFDAEDIEDAKEIAEDMVQDYYQEQINYYEDLLDLWIS